MGVKKFVKGGYYRYKDTGSGSALHIVEDNKDGSFECVITSLRQYGLNFTGQFTFTPKELDKWTEVDIKNKD